MSKNWDTCIDIQSRHDDLAGRKRSFYSDYTHDNATQSIFWLSDSEITLVCRDVARQCKCIGLQTRTDMYAGHVGSRFGPLLWQDRLTDRDQTVWRKRVQQNKKNIKRRFLNFEKRNVKNVKSTYNFISHSFNLAVKSMLYICNLHLVYFSLWSRLVSQLRAKRRTDEAKVWPHN